MYTLDHAHLAIACLTLVLTVGLAGCHSHQDTDPSAAMFMPPAAVWAVPPADAGPLYIGEQFGAAQRRLIDRAPDGLPPGF